MLAMRWKGAEVFDFFGEIGEPQAVLFR